MDIYEFFLASKTSYTDIQKIAIPIIRRGDNCIVVAPTGHGKTEAALLPVMDAISGTDEAGIKLLYITPLRALNRDMMKRLEVLCGHSGLRVGVRHGDTPQGERKKQSDNPPDVMVTTPETLQSMLINPAFRKAFRSLRTVIVDEVHELYHAKRGAQLSVGLERLGTIKGAYQRIGISATVGDPGLLGRYLCGNRPFKIAKSVPGRELNLHVMLPMRHTGKVKDFVSRFNLDDQSVARLEAISNLISESDRTLIFGNTRQVVELVGSRLVYMDREIKSGGVGVHHSSLDRNERIRIEEGFRSGAIRSIIATSSLELGIDIGAIDLVIQYASPRQALRLAQRAGRSGHKVDAVPKGIMIALNPIDAIEAVSVCTEVADAHFEVLRPHYNALDVLANQVCGIALDTDGTDISAVKSIIGGSLIYSTFKETELSSLLSFMTEQRMIGFDGNIITPGARTRMYYYGHLSVITDVKKFTIRNFIDNKIISLLDERFVAENIDEGAVFITKGLPWKVVSIEKDTVYVEPSTDLEASVPDWQGEDIPVSANVAAGALDIISNGLDRRSRFIDGEGATSVKEFLAKQAEVYRINAKTCVIESFGDYSAVYTWLGTAGNDTLAKLIAHIMAHVFNRQVTIKTTPYMLLVESASPDELAKTIRSLKAETLRQDLEKALPETEVFRYRFIAAAKVFGIIDRDASISKSMARKLIALMQGKPLCSEAAREVMENYFDIPRLSGFVGAVNDGTVKIVFHALDKPSPLTHEILNYSYGAKELITPLAPNSEIVKSFMDSILKKETKLMCTYCGFVFGRSLKEVAALDKIECEACMSPLVSVYSDEFKEILGKRKAGKRLSKNDRENYDEMVRYSNLISGYGPKAVIALSVYGIGLATAARALMMRRRDEKSFFIDLIEAQRTFIRTKKYWSA